MKKKLSFENGSVVLRDEDGKLFWSRHWVDIKGSYNDCERDDGGGYVEVFIEGDFSIVTKSDFQEECVQKHCSGTKLILPENLQKDKQYLFVSPSNNNFKYILTYTGDIIEDLGEKYYIFRFENNQKYTLSAKELKHLTEFIDSLQ